MYPEIEAVLDRAGYQKIQMNIIGISLSLKQTGERGAIVVTLDETTGHELSSEQFVHISEQIREFLKTRECYYNTFLYLLISEKESSERRLFENFQLYWRIIPSERSLLTYGNEDREFEDLLQPLTLLFPSVRSTGQKREANQNNVYRPNHPLQRLFGGQSIPYLNLFIVAVNVLIFFATDMLFFQNDSIVEWGALNWALVLNEGEWYRVFTSMFLHDGIQHIFNNMLVLLYIGSCVEQQLGSIRYGILYLGAGVLAGLTSMVYNMNLNENVYSLGASGAIFGVMGSLLFLVLFRKRYESGYNLRQIAIMVFFSLYGGFASQGVDNAAHVGGFIGGFLLTMVLSLFPGGGAVSYGKRMAGNHSNEFGGNR